MLIWIRLAMVVPSYCAIVLFQSSNMRWDLLVGYQHARMEDYLTIASTSNNAGPGGNGQVSSVADRFNTLNRFDGMALGATLWSLGLLVTGYAIQVGDGKYAAHGEIDGTEYESRRKRVHYFEPRSASSSNQRGGLCLDRFVVSPEFAVELGYAVTRNLDFTIGYTYLALPKVARAGDQIDVDTANIPETNRNFRSERRYRFSTCWKAIIPCIVSTSVVSGGFNECFGRVLQRQVRSRPDFSVDWVGGRTRGCGPSHDPFGSRRAFSQSDGSSAWWRAVSVSRRVHGNRLRT